MSNKFWTAIFLIIAIPHGSLQIFAPTMRFVSSIVERPSLFLRFVCAEGLKPFPKLRRFMRISRLAWGLDKAYVTATYIGAPHFRSGGWGFNPLDSNDPVLIDLRSRVKELKTRAEPFPICIEWDEESPILLDGVLIRHGSFFSAAASSLPNSCRKAYFRAVWPTKQSAHCPMLVLLPPNGDEGGLALEHGIGSVLLIPPFYAARRADDHTPPQPSDEAFTDALNASAALANCTAQAEPSKTRQARGLRKGQHADVARLLLTGLVGAQEALSLMEWLRRAGHRLVGVSGASLGAFVAAAAAAASRQPVAVALCLPCHSAEVCWTDSVMAAACDFPRLARDLRAAASSSGDAAAAAEYGSARGAELARGRLRGLLAELTDLRGFPPPVLAAAAVLVAAADDAYIAEASAVALARHWRGADLRLHAGGHVTSFVLQRGAFRRACADAMARLALYGGMAPFSPRLCVARDPSLVAAAGSVHLVAA